MHCMEDLRNDFAVLRAEMIATIKEAIEENGIAAGNASISQIQTLLAANREAAAWQWQYGCRNLHSQHAVAI